MANLRSCPFCGGEVKIIPEQVDARTVAYNFVCQNYDCGSNVYFDYSDREESIEAWNTRKPMEAVVAELVELRKQGYCQRVDMERCGESKSCINCYEETVREIVRGKE